MGATTPEVEVPSGVSEILAAWAMHRMLKPADLGPSAPEFAISEMDRWARIDASYRALVGDAMAESTVNQIVTRMVREMQEGHR
ncbi:MAG: hypothetical protein E6R04_08400 [Spirochaetes bacterium]|nr:MAG: hypothetical protein E6R04_08400 [Spirochaetota bacterium]